VLYDPDSDLYFARRLFDDDPPRPPAPTERHAEAEKICARGGVTVHAREEHDGRRTLHATVKGRGSYSVTAVLEQGKLVGGACGCAFFSRFGDRRGACKHLLALARVS
jgi:hypothetical protein